MSEIPPPLPPTFSEPAKPVSSGNVGLAIFCMVMGLLFLIPGGLCTVLGITSQFGAPDEAGFGMIFAIFGVPSMLIGVAFGYAAWRWRRTQVKPGP